MEVSSNGIVTLLSLGGVTIARLQKKEVLACVQSYLPHSLTYLLQFCFPIVPLSLA